MIDYLKNIIPRIKQYSKGLDKAEYFVDKNWIYIDDNNNQHEYIFLRDKRLIMTLNSATKEGSWELLPTGQLLIRRTNTDLIKLENIFVENALLILKQSATVDIPFVLINQRLIPDLDVVSYLENFEYEQERKSLPPSEQKYRVLKTGELVGPAVYVGKVLKLYDNSILNGNFKTSRKSCDEYVTIFHNTVKRVFFHIPYQYKNKVIKIEQEIIGDPIKGNTIVDGAHLSIPIDQPFIITDESKSEFTLKVNSEYKIIKLRDNALAMTMYLLLIGASVISLILLIAHFSNTTP